MTYVPETRVNRTSLNCVAGALLLCVALVGCAGQVPADSPEGRAELAARLAKLAADNGSFDRKLDKGAELARTATVSPLEIQLGRSLSDTERQQLWETLRTLLNEFVTSEQWQAIVTEVYAEAFTVAELQTILDFYDSPLGRKIISTKGTLDKQVEEDTEAFFALRLEEFIERADRELAVLFAVEAGS